MTAKLMGCLSPLLSSIEYVWELMDADCPITTVGGVCRVARRVACGVDPRVPHRGLTNEGIVVAV